MPRPGGLASLPDYSLLEDSLMTCGAETFTYQSFNNYTAPTTLPDLSPTLKGLRLDFLLPSFGLNDRTG